MALMEAVRDLYSQPYAARYPDALPGRAAPTAAVRPADAATGATGRPATYDYAYVRHGSGPVWLCVEPLGPWRTAHATAPRRMGRLGAPGAGHRGSSARPPGRGPDPGLRPFEHPYLRLFVPGFSTGRGAPPGLARASGVYAPARQLAPQGRTGTEHPDAAGPVPAQVTAWAEARHAAPTGIHWPFHTADARMHLKRYTL